VIQELIRNKRISPSGTQTLPFIKYVKIITMEREFLMAVFWDVIPLGMT
jgi:hypothetical protein